MGEKRSEVNIRIFEVALNSCFGSNWLSQALGGCLDGMEMVLESCGQEIVVIRFCWRDVGWVGEWVEVGRG